MSGIAVVPFRRELAPAFRQLNLDWIERLFRVEAADLKVLDDPERAIVAGLSALVMGYPCAVGISAPLSIVRGAGEAAERGILMRTGEAFQGYRLVTTIVLDKTGTLTEGRPSLR